MCLQNCSSPVLKVICSACSDREKTVPEDSDNHGHRLSGKKTREPRSQNRPAEPESTPIRRQTQKTYADTVKQNLPVLDRLLERLDKIESQISTPTRANGESKPPPKHPQDTRKQCLIMVNAQEQIGETAEERVKQERDFLQSVFGKLFDQGEEGVTILSAFRLGRKRDEGDKPRALKIVLASEDEVQRVMKRTGRLKGQPFRILRDLSPEDRIKMRAATQELRERLEAGERDLHIVDFRVVKRKPHIRWKPLAILPELILL